MIKLHPRVAGHFYAENRVLFPSVTTILSSVVKPGLDKWKRQTPNWRKISSKACVLGTSVHREIEQYLLGKRGKVKHKMQFRAFQEWQKETGFKCSAVELKVKSSAGFGGSLDLFGWINDKHFIIDLKTSKQLYPEMALQLAAYKFAFLETSRIKEIEIGVLRLDKYAEEVEWRVYTEDEYNEGIKEFLALCAEWHKKYSTQVEFKKKFISDE